MYEIEDKMTEAGFDKQRVKEAQVLYVLALSDFLRKNGFVDKLVGCFADRADGRAVDLCCEFGLRHKPVC